MIRETTPDAQGNYAGKKRPIYRSDNELKIREAVEAWGRPRWPNARVVHELVMGRGAVRADVAFITPNHIAVVEIKSDRDDTDRLLHQAGMFRAAVPELWIASSHSAEKGSSTPPTKTATLRHFRQSISTQPRPRADMFVDWNVTTCKPPDSASLAPHQGAQPFSRSLGSPRAGS
jgi:hypothetical protein